MFIKILTCLFFLSVASTTILAKEKVLVVGAGIIGASITYHLSLEDADVTVIDMQAPASHSSLGTFAWINASWAKQPQTYHSLNQQSVSYWHQLSEQLNIPVKWGGSLEWFDNLERQKRLSRQIQEQISWGEAARMITIAEGQYLQPKVKFTGSHSLAYSANDGAIDPVDATNRLLLGAQKYGATVKYPCKLESISETQHGKQANTSCGEISFDQLVLAVGAASQTVANIAKMDIPQRTTPGVIVVTEPVKPLLSKIIVAPGVHIHQRVDGRIVLGEQEGPPNDPAHQARLRGRPNTYPNTILAQQHGRRILAMAMNYVPLLDNAKIEHVYIGWRPLPLDGHPVLGYSTEVSDVYIAIAHSGVTLAPIIGRLVAREVISKKQLVLLDPYRPNRQFETVKRY